MLTPTRKTKHLYPADPYLTREYSAGKTWEALSDVADLITTQATNRTEFIQECKAGKLDGVVVAYRTFGSFAITGRIDEELVSVLPKSMLFLSHCGAIFFFSLSFLSFFLKKKMSIQTDRPPPKKTGAGYDEVDVHACSQRNPPIRVSNVPTAVDDATADVNMFLIIGALRNFNYGMHSLREGKWRGLPGLRLGHDPEGKVLGILGMGGIGRNLKRKAEAFGMKVVYHNRRKLSETLAAGAEYVSFDELLATSDVISLNLPLNVCFLFFFSLSLSLEFHTDIITGTYTPHHRQTRIRKDERRRRYRQHRPRRSHRRGCPCRRSR